MSTFPSSFSTAPNPSVNVDISTESADQQTVLTPRPLIIPSSQRLRRIMKIRENSATVTNDFMDTVDDRDVIEKARNSSASSSRLL